jgi:molybdate transport system substrate-binding protein
MRWIAPAVMVLLAGCGGVATDDQILVSAAASLTDAFTDVEDAFEAENPGSDVVLNLGGSAALREQILEGAAADVFAPADVSTMDRVVAADAVAGEPVVFARNSLQIAVPPGNAGGVTGLADFAAPDLLIGLCAEGVPCGDLGRRVLDGAGVVPIVDTNEPSVRALLTKIEAGELDAGLVYRTDVIAAEGRVEGIDVPGSVDVVTEYPVAVLAEAPNPDGANAFVDFVMSAAGRKILADHGFSLP